MQFTHQDFVVNRYGSRASDYISSAVHAAGEDILYIEAAVRDHPLARVLDLGCGGGQSKTCRSRTPLMIEAV